MASVDALRRRSKSAARLVELLARNPFSRVEPDPVIVLGNQKSGTTAVAALLAQVTGATVCLDLVREVVWPSFDRVKAGELAMADLVRRNRFAFSRKIVKEPQLTPFYDELRGLYPAASFVLIVRDPRDNIRSILDRLGVPGTDVDAAARVHHRNDRAWRLALDGTWLGIRADGPLEHLAARWNLCADVHLEHPDDVVLVRYEDFRADRAGCVIRLADQVGLTPRRAEVASERAYQPAGRNRGVEWAEFFGAANLATIERVCGSRMSALGYEPTPS